MAIAHWFTFDLECRLVRGPVPFGDERVDVREGDTLRASRDGMGRRHASLARAGDDGRIAAFWTFDDPASGFG
ncbi:MAG: hypothetical protein JWP87_6328 [Labilithrix sp.]|nr:hypothetical protein [Labilithrix sp.]